jgi:hypothetical protein
MRFGIEDGSLFPPGRREMGDGFPVFGDLDLLAIGKPFLDFGKIVSQIPDRNRFHGL